jgi:PncC family amidohydrolase
LTQAEELVVFLKEKSLTVAAAESCTAGLVADGIARIPGASGVFWGSFVCYTLQAKICMLGVGEDTLAKYGAVSAETAGAKARGALEKSGTDGAVSVTRLAGPDGDGSGAPVGTVWIGTALKNGPVKTEKFYFTGFRNAIREQAAREAVHQIFEEIRRQAAG